MQDQKQELAKMERVEKRRVIIAVIIGIIFVVFALNNVPKDPKPETEKPNNERPTQEHYKPLHWYLYPDSTEGTLPHHPITHEKGILIESI